MLSKQTVLENGFRLTKGFVNGKAVSVLRETGATTIFVSDTIIDKSQLKGNKKEVILGNSEVQLCPQVRIKIESPYLKGTVYALVLNNPFADIVVGNLGNLYPDFELSESVQIVRRNMAKKKR